MNFIEAAGVRQDRNDLPEQDEIAQLKFEFEILIMPIVVHRLNLCRVCSRVRMAVRHSEEVSNEGSLRSMTAEDSGKIEVG